MSWTAGGLANSKLKDADIWCGNAGAPAPPACLPKTLTGGGSVIANVIGLAWGTGCLNPNTGKFILPRLGGHADWAGNQVISLDVTASPDFWNLDKNYSTAYNTIASGGPWLYKYGTNDPASVHSYGAVCWLPSVSRVWSGGGIFWSAGGSSVPQVTFWWDPALAAWTEKTGRPGGYGAVTGWDEVGNRMLMRTSSNFYAYDPTLDVDAPSTSQAAWTKLWPTDQSGSTVTSSPLAIDSTNRKVYRIDQGSKTLRAIDLNQLQAKEVTLALDPSGDNQVHTTVAPGLLFRDNRLIALGPSSVSGRFAVYTAVVEGRGLSGQPPVQWVRDAVDANEPVQVVSPGNGIWNNFFGPVGNKYYFLNNDTDNQNVNEYTPSWSSPQTHTVNVVSGHSLTVLP